MSIPEKLEAMESAFTVAQLAAVLNLGKTAIYDLVRRNAIPHYRLAGLRFDPPGNCRLAAQPFHSRHPAFEKETVRCAWNRAVVLARR